MTEDPTHTVAFATPRSRDAPAEREGDGGGPKTYPPRHGPNQLLVSGSSLRSVFAPRAPRARRGYAGWVLAKVETEAELRFRWRRKNGERRKSSLLPHMRAIPPVFLGIPTISIMEECHPTH